MALLTAWVSAWKESLYLLRPQSSKLLLLVSLNAFVKGCSVLLRTILWWLIPVGIALYYYAGTSDIKVVEYLFYPLDIVTRWSNLYGVSAYYMRYLFVIYTGLFIWCLAIHPSVDRKDCYYFFSLKYAPRYGIGWFSFVLYNLLFWRALGGLVTWLKIGSGWHSFMYIVLNIAGLLIGCTVLSMSYVLPLFTLFFLFDTRLNLVGLVKFLINPIKMFVYNMPVIVCATLGFITVLLGSGVLVDWGLRMIFKMRAPINYHTSYYASFWLLSFISVCVLVFVCVINTLYIKRLYDNKNLYI